MIQKKVESGKGKTDFFECIDKISEINKQAGGLNDLFFEFAGPYLDYLCNILHTSPTCAAIFAGLNSLYDGSGIYLKELSEYLQIKCIQIIQYLDELEFLEENGLVYISKGTHHFDDTESISFELRIDTINALRNGDFHYRAINKNLTIYQFLTKIERLCEDCVQSRKSLDVTIKKMKNLLNDNNHLIFVQKIQKLELPEVDTFVLLRFFHYTVTIDEPDMDFNYLKAIYNHYSDFTQVKRLLNNGQYILIKKGLIENTCSDGFNNNTSFRLTESTKDEFLVEIDTTISNTHIKGLTRASTITEKKLFYPEKTRLKIDELVELLQHNYFKDVQNRLSKNGMRTGFACLFSGGPGTGKTETAYQIARICRRDIVPVDISSVKTKWFGESEKLIKALFDKYRDCVRKTKITPILLFNEADAVFSKRRILSENREGPGQTENAIQNIILQEIENLNGILIATTNLSNNMDSAFERRFLYKIEFEKPNLEARKAIWRSLVSDLSDEEASIIASRFDFSGGQIENIARKSTVHRVLSGNIPSLDDLIKYCSDENIDRESARRIGFCA